MPIQFSWLTSLLFIASATAHAYPPPGLKPRYLSTGTGISTPYPTSIANGTAVLTGTTPPPTSTTPSSSTAASPTSTSSDFYLVASGTGTSIDGYYLYVDGRCGPGSPGDLDCMVFTYSTEIPLGNTIATFHLTANHTIVPGYFSDGKGFGDYTYSYWFFNDRIIEHDEVYESVCEIVDGELKCVTGPNTLFYICTIVFLDGPFEGEPVNDNDLIPLLGPAVDTSDACKGVELTLKVVPV